MLSTEERERLIATKDRGYWDEKKRWAVTKKELGAIDLMLGDAGYEKIRQAVTNESLVLRISGKHRTCPLLPTDAIDSDADRIIDRVALEEATVPLTERQREVFELWAQGYIEREIGQRLGIERSVVSRHLTAARINMQNLLE